jgi:hypothetical protein
MGKLFGQLVFWTRVDVVSSNDEVRSKVVRLGSIHCDYSECEARLIQFKDLNSHVREVRGEFVFRDII